MCPPVYVEFPFDRIVGIHGGKKKPPDPPPDGDGDRIIRCGTFSYSVAPGNPNTITSPIGNPFEVRNPASRNYGVGWIVGVTLTSGGIYFGFYDVEVPCVIVMNTDTYVVTVRETGPGASDPRTLGFVHMGPPVNYSHYWNFLGVPMPTGPDAVYLHFTGGFTWTYNV